MREGFKIAHLGEACEILDSRRKPITKRDRVAGPYPYYGATGVLDHVDGYIFDERLVLVGEDGAKWGAGDRTAYQVGGKCWVNNHAHVIRPNRNVILDSWIIYYLNTINLAPFVSGLTVPKLNQGRLREIPIPIPPLPEQKRIVAILDEAFAGIDMAIANTEKTLANARELFESYLNSVFSQQREGWKMLSLEDVLDVQPRNGWSPPAANHSNSGTPVLTLSSVTGFRFRPGKIKHTSAHTDSTRHYWVENGDLLITRSNTPDLVGHVAVASGLKRPTIYPDLIMRMNTSPEKAVTKFIYYQLRSSVLRTVITGRAQGANPTMKKIGKKAVQSLPVVVPSLKAQKEVVTQLDDIGAEVTRLESIYQQKLAALAELKQCLLQKAFSGELTADAADAVDTVEAELA